MKRYFVDIFLKKYKYSLPCSLLPEMVTHALTDYNDQCWQSMLASYHSAVNALSCQTDTLYFMILYCCSGYTLQCHFYLISSVSTLFSANSRVTIL